MISSPKPNEATANSNANSQRFPTLPNKALAPTNSYSDNTIPTQQEYRQYVENDGDGIQKPLRSNWWQRLSLRNKATALAIALGVLPVLTLGTINYFLSSRDVRENATDGQQELATSFGDEIGRFMAERYGNIQVLSTLSILNNPKGTAGVSRQQKQEALDRISKASGYYDSIAVADLSGNVILETGQQSVAKTDYRKIDYFQEALRTKRPVISRVRKSTTSGKYSVFLAAPIFDVNTGEMISVVRTRMPIKVLNDLLLSQAEKSTSDNASLDSAQKYHLIDTNSKIFAASEKTQKLGEDARLAVPVLAQMQAANKIATAEGYDESDPDKQLISYAPIKQIAGMPKLNWSVFLHQDAAVVFAEQRRLLLGVLLGTGLTALVVGAIAAFLANRATRPITIAAGAVEKLGQGELDTRIRVEGQDEFSRLGFNINRMAGQIQNLLVKQEESSRQQLGIQEQAARQQAENAQQQTSAKEQLQKRALKLLVEVDPISRGDLTIRASVTEDEIGTIADSYNATVERLRKLVTQIQTAAQKMAATTSSSEASVQELSTEALRQTEEIAGALDRIQEMSNSTRAVAKSAEQAEVAVQQANQTVEAGEAAMNRTVEGILAIRETVVDTSTKVQRLGEASQKISKVVNLISRFAAQTNLLALKASIEAARAGEEGRGFAIIADEVRALASQSAQATTEIESLVVAIQTETNEVAAAMESGTEQVVEGTRLMNETRQSLNNITAASAQIGALVETIATAAVTQSQASESVTATMSNVAVSSNKTSNEAIQVSASFKELLEVATELQASAGQFKVS